MKKINILGGFGLLELIRQIEKYEYVSFDMFDTLIKRNVKNPKDVFRLMELHYRKNIVANLNNFQQHRIIAERHARELATKEEITLDDIYEQLSQIYDADLIEELKRLELRLELEICIINNDLRHVYEYCVKKKKKILIVSDMYLSRDVLRTILHKNGIDDYAGLYVSSEVGYQKASGKLFEHVLKDLNILKGQIIHVGDGKKNDYLRPRRLGIKSILVPNYINHLNYYCEGKLNETDLFSYQIMSSFINNTILDNETQYWKIGYEALGPMLYGFSKWLLAELDKRAIKKVFFFSRDGYIMQKAFDIINDTDIQTMYFYASRRALIVPMIWTHPELRDVVGSMYVPKRITVEVFLKKLGLDSDTYSTQMKRYGLKKFTVLNGDTLQDNVDFLAFYNEIKNDVIANSKLEYDLLIKYLNQIGFCGNIAVVDIGWNGNMQRSICELVEIEKISVQIVGFYTGLISRLDRAKKNITREMYGFLFQNGNNDDMFRRENSFNSLYETLFTTRHGSVERYENKGHSIEAVLCPYEYHSKEEKIIGEIQRGALDFVSIFSKSSVDRYIEVSSYCSFQNLQRLGTAPRRCDVDLFGDFRFYDTDIRYIAKPRKLSHYIFRPGVLLDDFLNAAWRIGFMRRLLRFKLPYFHIYQYTKKIVAGKE